MDSNHRVSESKSDALVQLGESPKLFGGGERVRTDDIQLAKLALSQLSYTPIKLLGALRGT